MTTLGIRTRPEAKAGNLREQVSSVLIKTTKQHPRNLRTWRKRGIRPDFWQVASVYGRPFCMARSSKSDTSFMLSVISAIATRIGIRVALR
jgi:hypothetical protein